MFSNKFWLLEVFFLNQGKKIKKPSPYSWYEAILLRAVF